MNNASKYFGNAVDADGRLIAAKRCLSCGYNLLGQTADGVCPECGTPLIDHCRLRFASRRWLRSLLFGIVIIVFALTVPSWVVDLVASALGRTLPDELGERIRVGGVIRIANAIGSLVTTSLLVTGVWFFTRPNPSLPSDAHRFDSRRIARRLMVPLLCAALFTTPSYWIVWPPVWIGGLFSALHILHTTLTYSLYVTVLCYCVQLIGRIPRRWLARSGVALVWGTSLWALAIITIHVSWTVLALCGASAVLYMQAPFAMVATYEPATANTATTGPASNPAQANRVPRDYYYWDAEGYVTLVAEPPPDVRIITGQLMTRGSAEDALVEIYMAGSLPQQLLIAASAVFAIWLLVEFGVAARQARAWHAGRESTHETT